MPSEINAAMTVEELLTAVPSAAGVFLRRHMACVGCAMAPFDTLSDVARIYTIAIADLLRDLESAAHPQEAP